MIPKKIFRALSPAYHFILSFLSALYYRFPGREMIIIGVTGTAGKTSTVYLIAKVLAAAGYKTGFTSTAVFSDGDREWLNDRKMTMPGRMFIQKTLRRMKNNNCRYAIVETTSEGIKQFRHRFINYDILVFTNLYPEHLEAHGGYEKYKAAKGALFARLKNCPVKYVDGTKIVKRPKSGLKKLDLNRVIKTTVINGDDAEADYFLHFWSEAKIVYSFDSNASLESYVKKLADETLVKDFSIVQGQTLAADYQGTKLLVNGQEINLRLLGGFNATNALAAYAVGLNQGISPDIIKSSLESVRSLAGKLEMIDRGQDFMVIVDYSFEPQALQKLYQVIELIPHHNIIHLLGSAGGGRDKARRAELGKLAASKAAAVIITNEDPYDEDPSVIINQVASGAEMAGKENGRDLFKILDRREAIRKALSLAHEGDLVLLTGKGAEQAICLSGGRKMPWDDRVVVREELGDKLCVDKR